uniref:DMT family transporter n=1 Tax=Thaumasiovibrio subtropicus TaxID=1891207 RepID=UPI00131D40CC|nr:DMT family transporter [Thaumasiovibrio subtropicus]
MGYSVLLGTLLILPFYLWETASGKVIPLNTQSVSTVIYTGVFASALAFLCWNRAVSILGAPFAGQFMHCIPIFTLLMATWILNEELERQHWVGIGIIIASLGLNHIAVKKRSGSSREK